ncbi:conserved hypothetical protein [Thermotomaculum hydrothermale]|uniref:DUF177 domain-containing protein n=1 Tax=Thermotomaculum hydrothermale TaxID=981385 RepID=A0A7R6SZK3_9BACT|nr:DUF177 domain-containing protein [Thermotomaculum hydrothermale]BBB32837.1 conserved hypothetical protein [Thermotomaculum hydrothermale]
MQIEFAKIEEKILKGDFDIINEKVIQNEFEFFTINNVNVSFRAYRIDINDVSIKEKIKGNITLICTNCLEEYTQDIDLSTETIFTKDKGFLGGEVTLTESELDVQYLEGETIDLKEEAIKTIDLFIPMSHTCKEDCKGLCPICGANRNINPCNCKIEKVDPRLQKLKEFLNKE